MDAALEKALNLLLESERAGVIALDALIADVKQDELKKFLSGSRAMEQRNAEELEALIRDNGGKPSTRRRAVRAQGRGARVRFAIA